MHEEVPTRWPNLDGARCLVLTGAGPRLLRGQDLNDRAVAPGGDAVDLGESSRKRWNPLVTRLTTLPFPVIARVNGVAAARAPTSPSPATLSSRPERQVHPELRAIGLIPDSGGTWALPRLVGQARALGLALTGEPLPADKAAEWGLIWKAVRTITRSRGGRFGRALRHRSDARPRRDQADDPRELEPDAAAGAERQRDMMRELGFSDDYREGVAAFMEKRKPTFTGDERHCEPKALPFA
jgi:2-(1,2-epoxy-1,2-dihydrophenyl)acetyl-CoA isomerase